MQVEYIGDVAAISFRRYIIAGYGLHDYVIASLYAYARAIMLLTMNFASFIQRPLIEITGM